MRTPRTMRTATEVIPKLDANAGTLVRSIAQATYATRYVRRRRLGTREPQRSAGRS